MRPALARSITSSLYRAPFRSFFPLFAATGSARCHRIWFRRRFPTRRGRDALLARAQAHRAGPLTIQPLKICGLCLLDCSAAPYRTDLVPASLRFLKVQCANGGLHFSLQDLDRFSHEGPTHQRQEWQQCALNSVNQPARARPQKLTIPEYLQLPSRRSGSGTKLPEAAAIGNVRPHRNRSFVGPRKLTFLRLPGGRSGKSPFRTANWDSGHFHA